MISNTYSITRITGGTRTESQALAALNTPLEEIEAALNSMSERLGALTGKCSVIYEDAPLSASCQIGSLVYYDTDVQRFAPARAVLRSTYGTQGESVEADCARVVGLVIERDAGASNVHGTLLCGGIWKSNAVADACLGASAAPGTYYLSPTTAGMAVTADELGGRLQQGVLTYLGNGGIVFGLHYMAHDNHWHASCALSGYWNLAAAYSGTAPAGFNYWYDMAADPAASAVGELSERTTAVFYNGLLQRQGDTFTIDEDGVLWCTTQPESGSVTLFNSYPFVYNGPIVRSIRSDNDALTVTNSNGAITLTQNGFVSGGTRRNALAVAAIAGKNVLYTPVVTGIAPGPGVNVSLSADGIATVSSADLVGALHDAYVVDHNGTNQASDGVLPYIMFPAGRTSSLTITMPVNALSATVLLDAHVWLMPTGVGNWSVETRWLPQPSAGSAVSLTQIQPSTSTVGGGVSGALSYLETSGYVRISGPGTLVSTISIASAPVSDVGVFRLGYRFDLVAAEPAVPDVSSVSAITGSGRAAAAIAKYTAVRASGSSGLVTCGSASSANDSECLGVSLHAAALGAVCDYVAAGLIADPAWAWTPGGAVYIGLDGALVQTVPSGAAFTQRIGTALSASVVQINVAPAI